MLPPRVVILTDRRDRSRLLADSVSTVADCYVAAADEPLPSCERTVGLIADLQLDRPGVKRLLAASAHPGHRAGTPLVVLLRSADGIGLNHAIRLGATTCFPETTDPCSVVAALFRLIAPDRTMVELLVQRSAMHSGQLLAEMLDAAKSGMVDTARIELGIDPVVNAIRDGGLRLWLDVIRVHDDFTLRHCLLVAGIAAHLGLHLGLSEPDRSTLVRAGLVHDVGKIVVPREILEKPGPLDAAEIELVRTHPAAGHALLHASGMRDRITLDATLHHHEMIDGSGYPHGLAGDQIGDAVRILTICDIASALIEHRPYRPPMVQDEALRILRKMAGHGLDSALVEVFASSLATAELPTAPRQSGPGH